MSPRGNAAGLRDRQSLSVERGDKALLCRAIFLAEPVLNADPVREIQHPFVFRRGHCPLQHGTVWFGELGKMAQRGILIQNTDIDVISIGIMKIAQDFLGIPRLAGKEQMADEKPSFQETGARVEDGRPHLAEHFRDGAGCLFKIVGSMGKPPGELRGAVFQVGEVDVREAFQKAQGSGFLVAGAVVYDRDGESAVPGGFQRQAYLGEEMSRRDQVEIGSALFLQFQKNLAKPLEG